MPEFKALSSWRPALTLLSLLLAACEGRGVDWPDVQHSERESDVGHPIEAMADHGPFLIERDVRTLSASDDGPPWQREIRCAAAIPTEPTTLCDLALHSTNVVLGQVESVEDFVDPTRLYGGMMYSSQGQSLLLRVAVQQAFLGSLDAARLTILSPGHMDPPTARIAPRPGDSVVAFVGRHLHLDDLFILAFEAAGLFYIQDGMVATQLCADPMPLPSQRFFADLTSTIVGLDECPPAKRHFLLDAPREQPYASDARSAHPSEAPRDTTQSSDRPDSPFRDAGPGG